MLLMQDLILLVIIIGVSITSILILYKLLKKVDFDLKGIELICYPFTFTLFMHVIFSEYLSFSWTKFMNGLSLFIIIAILILLASYYLIRLIKKQEYVSKSIIGLYLILSITNIISLIIMFNVSPNDFANLIGFIFILVIEIAIIIYLLLINLITFIIKYKKNTNVSNNISIYKNKKNLIIIILSALLPFIYSLSFLEIYNHLETQRKNDSQSFVLDYLKNKYNDQDFIIENITKTENCEMFGCNYIENNYTLTINSKYNKNFIIQVDIVKKEVIEDNFMFSYLSYLTNEDINYYSDIENFIIKNLNHNNLNNKLFYNLDCEISFKNSEFDEEKFGNENFSQLPNLNDLYKYMHIKKPKIKVKRIFKENELEEFNNYILSIYKLLANNYSLEENGIVEFEFAYNNPFSNSKFYKNEGYIRDAGSVYLIYTDSTPTTINK